MNNFSVFLEINKDAIASIGIILTLFVSAVSLYFSIKNNKAIHYTNSVTKSRIEWIEHLRGRASHFCRLCSRMIF